MEAWLYPRFKLITTNPVLHPYQQASHESTVNCQYRLGKQLICSDIILPTSALILITAGTITFYYT